MFHKKKYEGYQILIKTFFLRYVGNSNLGISSTDSDLSSSVINSALLSSVSTLSASTITVASTVSEDDSLRRSLSGCGYALSLSGSNFTDMNSLLDLLNDASFQVKL